MNLMGLAESNGFRRNPTGSRFVLKPQIERFMQDSHIIGEDQRPMVADVDESCLRDSTSKTIHQLHVRLVACRRMPNRGSALDRKCHGGDRSDECS